MIKAIIMRTELILVCTLSLGGMTKFCASDIKFEDMRIKKLLFAFNLRQALPLISPYFKQC